MSGRQNQEKDALSLSRGHHHDSCLIPACAAKKHRDTRPFFRESVSSGWFGAHSESIGQQGYRCRNQGDQSNFLPSKWLQCHQEGSEGTSLPNPTARAIPACREEALILQITLGGRCLRARIDDGHSSRESAPEDCGLRKARTPQPPL
jgi:hypothetical protein